MMRLRILAAVTLLASPALAVDVVVEDHGPVPLERFECADTPQSSWIRTICYDEDERYMLMRQRDVWWHFCSVDPSTVAAFVAAPSVGRYYHAEIEDRFRCGPDLIPKY